MPARSVGRPATENGYEVGRLARSTTGRNDVVRRIPARRPTGQRRPARPHSDAPVPPRERFLRLDRYRVEREWKRYEGTPQRDLFRELRVRFLDRHRARGRWSVDVGSGPGRFSSLVGEPTGRAVQLDLSREMLAFAREKQGVRGTQRLLDLVQGDVIRAPLRPGRFSEVAVLGNGLGFAGESAERFLDAVMALVAPTGTLLLEVVCGPGESARYLHRLPPGAVRRLFAAPVNLVRGRVEREGFGREPGRRDEGPNFRRFSAPDLQQRLRHAGFEIRETLSVAPSLGPDAARIAAVRPDPLAWLHLLEVEEAIGHASARHASAAALLIAGRRTGSDAGATPTEGAPAPTDRAESAKSE